MKIDINKEEVLKYFETLITDDETWSDDEEINKVAAYMIHGALVFANVFEIITDEEKEKLINS